MLCLLQTPEHLVLMKARSKFYIALFVKSVRVQVKACI